MKIHGGHIRNILRVAFVGLTIFEILGAAGVTGTKITYTWFGLILTVIVAFAALELAHGILRAYWNVNLPWMAWAVTLVALSFDAVGDIHGYYDAYGWYDQIGHYLGTMVAAIFILTFLMAIESAYHHRELEAVTFLFTLTTAVTFGVLYEIEEYLEDMFNGSHRLGDGPDTANDLLMDLLGALTVVVVAKWYYHRKAKRAAQLPT